MAFAIQSGATLVVAAAVMSVIYVAACVVVVALRRRLAVRAGPLEAVPVTVLKPLCGAEPELEENLRSFCREAGPGVQLLFGARDADDPALAVARLVLVDFPDVDAQVLTGATALGLNAKINTVARLAPLARHRVLMVADSDARIAPGDLRRIIAPLVDPTVGVVSCLFRSRPTDTFWSRLGALSIDEWFMPSVLISRALRSPSYCSGPVLALRQEVLEAIGGFAPLASVLADDYELGARVRRLGYRSLIADREVAVTVDERSCAELVRHEVRWMRTTRTVAPFGHASLVLTYALPLTVAAAIVTGAPRWSLGLLALAVALRTVLHTLVASGGGGPAGGASEPAPLWMVVLRDFFSLGMWAASYGSRSITWRGRTLRVDGGGVLRAPSATCGDPCRSPRRSSEIGSPAGSL